MKEKKLLEGVVNKSKSLFSNLKEINDKEEQNLDNKKEVSDTETDLEQAETNKPHEQQHTEKAA